MCQNFLQSTIFPENRTRDKWCRVSGFGMNQDNLALLLRLQLAVDGSDKLGATSICCSHLRVESLEKRMKAKMVTTKRVTANVMIAKRISGARCRANVAHLRQSRPDSGLGFQVQGPSHLLERSRERIFIELMTSDR